MSTLQKTIIYVVADLCKLINPVDSVGAQLLQAQLSSKGEDGDDISVEGEEGEEVEEEDDASSDQARARANR
eukprot:1139600-Pelagomonas_calceolata.AAC.2